MLLHGGGWLPSAICWRIIEQHVFEGNSVASVARNLMVSEASVRRMATLYYATGGVTPRQRGHRAGILSSDETAAVIELLREDSSLYLDELCDYIQNTF